MAESLQVPCSKSEELPEKDEEVVKPGEVVRPSLSKVAAVIKAAQDGSCVTTEMFKDNTEPSITFSRVSDSLDAFVCDSVLSAEECEYLIEITETMDYSFWNAQEDAPKDFRNADTIEIFHEELAEILWQRLKPYIEPVMKIEPDTIRWQRDIEGDWVPYGTNKNVLFARYRSGGHFAPHTDGFNIIDFNHRSMYTLLVYLNDCDEGGQTRFYQDAVKQNLTLDNEGRFTGLPKYATDMVHAKRGRALVFHHDLVHEGVGVGNGSEKYIIRSDIMYRRSKLLCDSERDRAAFKLYQEAQELSNSSDAEKIDESMQMFRKCFKMSPGLAQVYGM